MEILFLLIEYEICRTNFDAMRLIYLSIYLSTLQSINRLTTIQLVDAKSCLTFMKMRMREECVIEVKSKL